MNISEMWQKIKGWPVEDAAMPLLVVLVGLGSFGLGRMSAMESNRAPIAITQSANAALAVDMEKAMSAPPAEKDGGRVIASKTGTKYHFPWCAGALQISEKNKIYFDSAEKARTMGYTPAGNCKGLE